MCHFYLYLFVHLEISVNDPIHVTVVDRLQNLLDTVAGVCLRVELPGHNVLKQLAPRHPETDSQSANISHFIISRARQDAKMRR